MVGVEYVQRLIWRGESAAHVAPHDDEVWIAVGGTLQLLAGGMVGKPVLIRSDILHNVESEVLGVPFGGSH